MASPFGGFSFHATPSYTPSSGDGGAGRRAESEVTQLKGEIERLLMITEALWTLMKEERGYSDDELIKRIAEIDLRDGMLDGRVAPDPSELPACPQCHRPVGKRRPTCLYCGVALVRGPFER